MTDKTCVPVKMFGGDRWGWLSVFGHTHYIVSEERPKETKDEVSLSGNHKVRAWRFKKNVHWRPAGTELEISSVAEAGPPPRRAQRG